MLRHSAALASDVQQCKWGHHISSRATLAVALALQAPDCALAEDDALAYTTQRKRLAVQVSRLLIKSPMACQGRQQPTVDSNCGCQPSLGHVYIWGLRPPSQFLGADLPRTTSGRWLQACSPSFPTSATFHVMLSVAARQQAPPPSSSHGTPPHHCQSKHMLRAPPSSPQGPVPALLDRGQVR